MRHRIALAVLAASLCSVPAFASYGQKPSLPAPGAQSSSSGSSPEAGAARTPREEADAYYRDAYDDVMKGSKELAAGKPASAKKRFQRALGHAKEAVELDSTRYEAWNLVGYTSRMLGDYPNSFAAYRVALRQKPDFALAREYYGEGLLETGDLAGALAQLAWLKKIGDAEQTAELQEAVDRYRAAHPDDSGAPTTAAH